MIIQNVNFKLFRKTIFSFAVLLTFIFLLIPLVYAESTFFDNPDDAFIMGGSATGEVIAGTTGPESCTYEWNCTNWSECLQSGKQIRNCINIGTCSDTYNPPEIKQNCIYTAPGIEKENKELENETKKQEIPTEKIIKNKIYQKLWFWILIAIIIVTLAIVIIISNIKSKTWQKLYGPRYKK